MNIIEKTGCAGLGIAAILWATPSMGFLVNETIATGAAPIINQQIQVARNASVPDDEPWQLQLQAQGSTDFYVHRLAIAPGGYSGWHSHPGLLIGTVVSGSIDFFDAACNKTTYKAGEVYHENDQPHAIINNGSAPAELMLAFLVKRGAARRLDAPAPECAPETNIP